MGDDGRYFFLKKKINCYYYYQLSLLLSLLNQYYYFYLSRALFRAKRKLFARGKGSDIYLGGEGGEIAERRRVTKTFLVPGEEERGKEILRKKENVL